MLKLGGLVLLSLAAALLAAGCGGKTVTVDADTLACVYDGSANGGHRFKETVEPGERVSVGKTDEVVMLPTSTRFYNMTTTQNRNALAPSRVLAFAKGQTPVWIEGVLKFRFNTAGNKACDWYSKHGRRNAHNGDLGFDVRGKIAQRQAGWYRFLAESHGDTMKQVVHDGSSEWTWEQLAYGSDPTVKRALTAEAVSVAYGKQIGALFTKYLRLNLGNDYFCGVQPALTGGGETPGCPPMYFQVLSVYPRDGQLAEEHDQLQRLDAALQRQRQGAKLKARNRASAIASARAQKAVIEAQIVNTRLAAQNDATVQKCLILARVGLDCDGHRQQIIVAGLPSTRKGG
jgi:hypothetical protein